MPTKLVVITPLKPYNLKGKDGTQIDFMCLTMIDQQASSLFEKVELPVMETLTSIDKKGTKTHK